jgi:hypothetical protein
MDLGDTTGAQLLAELEASGIACPPRVVLITGDPQASRQLHPKATAIVPKPFELGLLELALLEPNRIAGHLDALQPA